MPSTLICLLAYPPPCCAPRRILRPPPYPVLSFTLRYCSSHCTYHFAFTNPLSPVLPVLCSTLPLLRMHLDFCMPFFPPCTQLCPCPVLILTPDLYPAPVCAALASNISLLCHPCPTLLPSLSQYPPYPALAPVLPSTMACLCVLFTMPFLHRPDLSDALCLARRHVLIPDLPFGQPSATPSTMC